MGWALCIRREREAGSAILERFLCHALVQVVTLSYNNISEELIS